MVCNLLLPFLWEHYTKKVKTVLTTLVVRTCSCGSEMLTFSQQPLIWKTLTVKANTSTLRHGGVYANSVCLCAKAGTEETGFALANIPRFVICLLSLQSIVFSSPFHVVHVCTIYIYFIYSFIFNWKYNIMSHIES